MWLRMGSFGPVRVVTARRHAHRTAAVSARRQPVQPARPDRSRLHRHAGQRLRPHHRRRHAQRLLGRRPRRRRVRPVHPAVHHQLQSLELAAVSLRRVVRHDALVPCSRGILQRQGIALNGIVLLSSFLNSEHRLQRRRADRRRRLGVRSLSADRSGDGVVPSRASGCAGAERAACRKSKTSR